MADCVFSREYEVIVAGGGIAGVAAAVAAARAGRKTALLEKTIFAGGLATTGLVYIYLPLCDGAGTQVTQGLAEELLQRSLLYGPGQVDPNWRDRTPKTHDIRRYRCSFSPASFMLALDEVLQEAGVEIWYDTLLCGVNTAGRRVTSVEVENKSGRGRLTAEVFVDATGDCDLARRAGCPVHDEWNSLSLWSIEYNEETEENPWGYLGRKLRMQANGIIPTDQTETHKGVPENRLYRGISGRMVSEFVLRGRAELRESYRQLYASGKTDRNHRYPVKLPAMAQFRKIFAIDGRYLLRGGEYGIAFADSIGMVGDWRKPNEVWEIPYRALLPRNLDNLLAAGRCIAATGDAWEVTRVIPTAALTGEAAGIAAALAVEKKTTPAELPIGELQSKLNTMLHLPEAGLSYR